MSFTVIIPARYGSTRFPGKPLVNIYDKPMIQHVVERAHEAGASRVIVATDDSRIERVCAPFADVCMTSDKHTSGTERLAEVVDKEGIADHEIIVNVQGDEPFVPAENIQQVANNLAQFSLASMATLATPINDAHEVLNPNIVKVVTDQQGYALYFSRSVIPFERETMLQDQSNVNITLYSRHIGLYAYHAAYIKRYVSYPASALENIESLEQLRALWYGDKIHVATAKASPPIGIDTPEDLAQFTPK